MHKISNQNNWDKSWQEHIRDYIPLVILIAMVIIGIVLVIST